MYVTEHLEIARNPLFSFEIIPPLRGHSAHDILEIVDCLDKFNPPFIDVTSHSADVVYQASPADGKIRRVIKRKRPGTISICGIIQNRYGIDTVPHLLCFGATREESEDAMIELNFLGIHNVLALRGDETRYKPPLELGNTINTHASDLVEQLDNLRKGRYLEDIENSEPIDMCIGAACYPEKHVESPDMKSEIKYLKQKVNLGADYLVTQMFFNNQNYFDLVRLIREAGIDKPVIPGLKIINSRHQLKSLPDNFHISLPEELAAEILENPKHARQIGINHAVRQSEELFNSGVKCIHYYIMNDTASAEQVLKHF